MASGNTLAVVSNVHSYDPPASAYAQVDTRNGHRCLDFDDATDESAVFSLVMPQHYAGGGISIYPHFAMTSATSGNVVLTVELERIADGGQDLDSDGFAAAVSATIAVPGTSGVVESSSTIALTDGAQMDSVAAGDAFRLRITRDADNASDTATGDLELIRVEIRES